MAAAASGVIAGGNSRGRDNSGLGDGRAASDEGAADASRPAAARDAREAAEGAAAAATAWDGGGAAAVAWPNDGAHDTGESDDADRDSGAPSLPRFLKRDLRAWAPGRSYSLGEELRDAGEVTHCSMIGCTLAGRVQGKNILVHTGADGCLVGKCSICRAWTSPHLAPASASASSVPPVDMDADGPPAEAADAARAAAKHPRAGPGRRQVRGVSMCAHTIALLLHFLGEKQALTATAKPALFTQLRTLGPERLIALVGVVAGRNPALLGRLQSYVTMVSRPAAGLSSGIQRGEEFLAAGGFNDPSAPLPQPGTMATAAVLQSSNKPPTSAEALPESIYQRTLAQALRQYAQASYSTGNAVQHRQDAYRSSVGPLLESRFDEIRAVPVPSLTDSNFSGETNPLQQLVPLAGEIFAACRSAGINAWQSPHHMDAKAMVTKLEEYVVERLLLWAWKPITANGVGGLRPSNCLTFEVTAAQRRAWLAAVERTPSTVLWPALARLHEPIQCGSRRRAAVDIVVKATNGFGAAAPVESLFAERLPHLVGFQFELLRQWQSYAEAFGLCHAADRPVEACMALVEATVRHRAAREASSSSSSDGVASELSLLDQVVEYVQQHQDAVRKQCKDVEEGRVLALLFQLEKVSVVHCYNACVACERHALAADCLMRSTQQGGRELLTDLLVSHPEMLRNPQDCSRYISALQPSSSNGSSSSTPAMGPGDIVEVDRAQCVGEGGRGTVVSSDAQGNYAVKYANAGPREKGLPAEALTLLEAAPAGSKPDQVSGSLLRVYAAAATGLSGQDDYWGGRGHIDQPAWTLVQKLAQNDAGSVGAELLDEHVGSVLQLFARTSLTPEQFREKHSELRTTVYPNGRWKQLALPKLNQMCEPSPEEMGVSALLSRKRWVEFLLEEGDTVAAVQVVSKTGHEEVQAMRFDNAVTAFEEALKVCGERSDDSEPSAQTLRLQEERVAVVKRRDAAAAAGKGDYSLLSDGEQEHVERTLKDREEAAAATKTKAAVKAKAAKAAMAKQQAAAAAPPSDDSASTSAAVGGTATGEPEVPSPAAMPPGKRLALASTQAKAKAGSGRGAGSGAAGAGGRGKKRGRGRPAGSGGGGAKRTRTATTKPATVSSLRVPMLRVVGDRIVVSDPDDLDGADRLEERRRSESPAPEPPAKKERRSTVIGGDLVQAASAAPRSTDNGCTSPIVRLLLGSDPVEEVAPAPVTKKHKPGLPAHEQAADGKLLSAASYLPVSPPQPQQQITAAAPPHAATTSC